MDFDREFTSARFLSNRFCVARLLLFNSSTWAIVSFAFWKCFFSKPAITRSVSSVINFNVSITKYELFFYSDGKDTDKIGSDGYCPKLFPFFPPR